ncbi:MAG TPA: HNH endonuclease [Clostridiales bacterium]|nr:HNH endonuclease [Clostridiales bacterium]
MMKSYKCDWCGKEFIRMECYMKGKKHVFCSRKCVTDFSNKIKNPSGYASLKNYANISSHMTKLNEDMNPTRMVFETREKLREAHLGKGDCNGYSKIHSRLAHRVIVEQRLGRPLASNEVVHHRDGNRYNNIPDNLVVFPTAGDHTRFHNTYRWFIRQLEQIQEEENASAR